MMTILEVEKSLSANDINYFLKTGFCESRDVSLLDDRKSILHKTLQYWFLQRHNRDLVPVNHYFHTYLSLSALALGHYEMANIVLDEYFRGPKSISLEFNKYALLRIQEKYIGRLSRTIAHRIEKETISSNFSVNFSTWTGNNWLFLRAITHLRLFVLKQDIKDWNVFCEYLDYICQLNDHGLFFDFPSKERLPLYSFKGFPFTYSFKMLAIIMEIYETLREMQLDKVRQETLRALIQVSLPAHLNLIAPDGETLFYGRSDSTLFGYANIIYVLSCLKINNFVSCLWEKVLGYINKWFVGEGVFLKGIAYEGFKDEYIYDGVYVSYFLAKVIQSIENKAIFECEEAPEDCYHGPKLISNSAGFVISGKGYYYFLTSEGCSIKTNLPDFYSYRYTGLTFTKYFNELTTNSAPLLQVNRRNITPNNLEIPFCPMMFLPGLIFAVFIFDDIQYENHETKFVIKGSACIEILMTSRLLRKMVSVIRRCFSEDIVQPLYHRFKDMIRTYFKNCERLVEIDKDTGNILIRDKLSWGKYRYVIPSDWKIRGKNLVVVSQTDESTKIETCSGEVRIQKYTTLNKPKSSGSGCHPSATPSAIAIV